MVGGDGCGGDRGDSQERGRQQVAEGGGVEQLNRRKPGGGAQQRHADQAGVPEDRQGDQPGSAWGCPAADPAGTRRSWRGGAPSPPMTIPPPMASDERRPYVGGLGPGLLGPQGCLAAQQPTAEQDEPMLHAERQWFLGVMGRCRLG
jgi:hypothetical protein